MFHVRTALQRQSHKCNVVTGVYFYLFIYLLPYYALLSFIVMIHLTVLRRHDNVNISQFYTIILESLTTALLDLRFLLEGLTLKVINS